jgi:hypothetical protein
MRSRSSLPFRAAPLRVEDPPSHDALLTAFLSSLSLDERSGSAVLFGAAVRHFLHWLELHGIAIRTIDDRPFGGSRSIGAVATGIRRSSQYKADKQRVRRFVRFLEDQGYVEVDDGIDDLPRHLADYSMGSIAATRRGPAQAYRSEAEHFAAWLRIARRQWADIDDTIIDQYARMIVDVRSGASEASWLPRARSGGGDALGTSSSSCAAAVSSHQSNRWRTMTRTWRLTWRGSSNIAAPPMRRSGATGPISDGSCRCWASLRNGMPPDSGARSNDEARRRRAPASLLVTIMRSYIRFLVVRRVPAGIVARDPSVQRYRLSTLPRHVDPATIEQIIAPVRQIAR